MLKGEIILKGDKSITHRAIMLVAITEGKTKIIEDVHPLIGDQSYALL